MNVCNVILFSCELFLLIAFKQILIDDFWSSIYFYLEFSSLVSLGRMVECLTHMVDHLTHMVDHLAQMVAHLTQMVARLTQMVDQLATRVHANCENNNPIFEHPTIRKFELNCSSTLIQLCYIHFKLGSSTALQNTLDFSASF